MYRDRLLSTPAKSTSAEQLKSAMLRYHDFRHTPDLGAKSAQRSVLANWQKQRLIQTHQDLYKDPNYFAGLEFLFSDLYGDQDFSDRDQNLERIFPKLVKLLPDSVLETLALLIELNLATHTLDEQLRRTLFEELRCEQIDESLYCEAYRLCNNRQERHTQLNLTQQVGQKLDKYARSQTLLFSLKISRRPAEMAGLSALHSFLNRGFSAFHSMENIPHLMEELIRREQKILDAIFRGHNNPFDTHFIRGQI